MNFLKTFVGIAGFSAAISFSGCGGDCSSNFGRVDNPRCSSKCFRYTLHYNKYHAYTGVPCANGRHRHVSDPSELDMPREEVDVENSRSDYISNYKEKRNFLERLADTDKNKVLDNAERMKMYKMCGVDDKKIGYVVTLKDLNRGIKNYLNY